MTLAWSTLVALLFLLPGFVAIITFLYHLKMPFSEGSLLGVLVSALIGATLAHASYLFLLGPLLSFVDIKLFPPVDYELLFTALMQPKDSSMHVVGRLAASIERYHWCMVAYAAYVVAAGAWIGKTLATSVLKYQWSFFEGRWLIPHAWLPLLARPQPQETVIGAEILTDLAPDEKSRVLYKGIVNEIGFKRDGTIAYTLTSLTTREMLALDPSAPQPGPHAAPNRIAVTSQSGTFHIEGSHIHNISLMLQPLPAQEDAAEFAKDTEQDDAITDWLYENRTTLVAFFDGLTDEERINHLQVQLDEDMPRGAAALRKLFPAPDQLPDHELLERCRKLRSGLEANDLAVLTMLLLIGDGIEEEPPPIRQ